MNWLAWLKRPAEQGIPAWLVAALTNAWVAERGTDDEGNPRLMVRVSGLGAWHWEGINPAAERIARHTELPLATCRKAARILADVLARRNHARAMGKPHRKTWVNSWESEH